MTSHNAPNPTQRAVIRCLILAPKTENELMVLLNPRAGQGKVELVELRQALRELKAEGTIAVTGKRFWLRGLGRAALVKAQDDRDEKERKRYG